MTPEILVIEDNPDNMTLVEWALEDAGYTFCGAESAEEGIILLKERPFAMVLMDISLPGMDGKEATRRLRRDPQFASLPIIAVTAHAIADEERAIHECGVDDVLTKPLCEEQLLETIESFLAMGVNRDEITSR